MMPFWKGSCLAVLVIVAASCGEQESPYAIPSPREISPNSVGHFCGMLLTEHPGPKGQILLSGQAEPVWFASVVETFAFTMLEEEPKNIAAIYVTDMGRAQSWENPGPGTWIDARKSAVYVIEARVHGSMGGNEAVPFSNPEQAERFVVENGGRIVSFEAMPRSYILQSGELARAPETDKNSPQSGHP